MEQEIALFSSFNSIKEDSYQEDERALLQKTIAELRQSLQDKTKQLDRVTHYLDSIIKNMHEGLLFINHAGIITTYNDAAEQILGQKKKDVLFTRYSENFSNEAFGFSMSEVLQKMLCPQITYTLYSGKQGREKELEISTSPVARKNRSQQGVIVVIRDITKQRMQMKLEQQQIRMQELGQMAATVAHEIRNPLGGIEGFASLLQSDLEKDHPEWSRMVGYIIEGSKTIGQLIENVLQSARPLCPKLETIDIVEQIEEIRKQIAIDPSFTKPIQIHLQAYDNSIYLLADRAMIRSSLIHLLRNAYQAIDHEGVIHITAFTKEDNVVLTIKDSGPGIPLENLPRLFSPFFTTKDEGNGLGLHQSYKIIQSHGGQIDVKSSSDCGTLFIITLPIKGCVL
ncbi:MAG: ATP-binding protein [Chlamydiae bacterium]|nr:ATP-binding protein [Chlamydiota bacterium]